MRHLGATSTRFRPGTASSGIRDEVAARKMHEEFASADMARRHLLTVGNEPVGEVAERILEARTAGHLNFTVPIVHQ